MGYRLTRKAVEDLRQIYVEGIAHFGAHQAASYHDSLKRIFDMLAYNPGIARSRTEISPPVRVHPHKAHVIIYSLDENKDVLILRVRHSREDWARYL